MSQPTFFAHDWPRLDHQVYWSGFAFSFLNTSTKPRSSNTPVSQARSSGRKPEFFRLERQFLRSISLWAMFQSPHRMISCFLSFNFFRWRRKSFRNLNLDACRCAPAEPEGMYSETTHRLPKRAST